MLAIAWWKWPVGVLAVLAALVLVAVGIGAALPVAHTATVSTHLPAPPEAVWRLVTDTEAYPDWRSGVDAVEALPDRDGRRVWRETGATGATTFEVTESEPGRRLVARIADPDLPFGGSWTYELEPEADGTRLTITEDGEVYNPFFRFMSRFVFGHDATMRRFLDDAARVMPWPEEEGN